MPVRVRNSGEKKNKKNLWAARVADSGVEFVWTSRIWATWATVGLNLLLSYKKRWSTWVLEHSKSLGYGMRRKDQGGAASGGPVGRPVGCVAAWVMNPPLGPSISCSSQGQFAGRPSRRPSRRRRYLEEPHVSLWICNGYQVVELAETAEISVEVRKGFLTGKVRCWWWLAEQA